MGTERNGKGRGEWLLEVLLEATSDAPPEIVYDLLADLQQHLEWGGRLQKKGYRLMSMDAPPGLATVGTEFLTTGIDPGGTFRDASVVTEATRPEVFEFVSTARQHPKRGEDVVWTNVHRYELASRDGGGCAIRYSIRVMQLSRPTWWTKSGFTKAIVRVFGGANSRVGLKNLARQAGEMHQADSTMA